ncbi:MAG: ribosome silencing factor [Ardenticatenaceae bacterium]|nr:ribosome silencing factor [Ardenticatenaceae bacterium]
MKEVVLDAAALARQVVEVIEDRKGSNIVMLDLRKVTPIADYFVVATGDNERLLRALVKAVDETAAREGVEPFHVEGEPESGWVLMDYSDVVVHLFSPQARSFYRLEDLYDDAPAVVRIQ